VIDALAAFPPRLGTPRLSFSLSRFLEWRTVLDNEFHGSPVHKKMYLIFGKSAGIFPQITILYCFLSTQHCLQPWVDGCPDFAGVLMEVLIPLP